MAENNTDNVASLIELAGDITIAWLQNPNVNPGTEDVPAFLKNMHAAISGLSHGVSAEPEPVTYEPAAPVRSSVKSDHIVSLIDGRKYKTLKRHLGLHGLTPDQYRERYGLKADYPMVAPDYAAQRREIAQKLGLGRKPTVSQADVVPQADAAEPAIEAPAPKSKRGAGKARADGSQDTVTQALVQPETAPATPRTRAAKAKADTAPPVEDNAPSPAKAKRMARQPKPAASETAASSSVDTGSKPKRAAAKAKADTGDKTDAPPAKRSRAKKSAADGAELSES